MDEVVIGMDQHKRSVTIEARDRREVLRVIGTFPTSTPGYRAMVKLSKQWPRRFGGSSHFSMVRGRRVFGVCRGVSRLL